LNKNIINVVHGCIYVWFYIMIIKYKFKKKSLILLHCFDHFNVEIYDFLFLFKEFLILNSSILTKIQLIMRNWVYNVK